MKQSGRIGSPFSGCGFVGAFAFNTPQKENILKRIDLKRMVASIRHRGPEAQGTWKKDGIMFGHTRLSILDLSERGNQPMTRDHFTIVSNGEVYNFEEIRSMLEQDGITFTSHTDTEVIIRAYQKWGADALHKFNGMFAFAIWDDKKKTLFVARDRIGIKPFYYFKDKNVFLFGSEVQALMHSSIIPVEINWDTVYREILINTFYKHKDEQTLIKNVLSIPPGHFAVVKPDGQFRMERYWDIPAAKEKREASQMELAGELNELMEDSVRLRLVSDVPVAAFLSGGMDSSVINVLAARLVKDYKLTAITVTYEGGGRDMFSGMEDQDLQYSRIVAGILKDKIDHRVIKVKSAEISVDAIDTVLDLASLSDDIRNLTVLGNYKTVKDQGFKVVLNGQGADEIMGGYISLRTFIDAVLDVQKPDKESLKNAFQYLAFVGQNTLSEEFLGYVDGIYEELHNYLHGFPGDLLEKTHRYLLNTELQRVLKFEDIYSMHSSVECRVPFLDHRLIEWAFSIPFQKHIRLEDRMGKILLREAAKVFLPETVIERPKQTFPAPNQDRSTEVLHEIYRTHHEEIIRSEIVRRVYKKDFLKIENPQIPSNELWIIIALWRWVNKLKQFT